MSVRWYRSALLMSALSALCCSAACPVAMPGREGLDFACHGDEDCAEGYTCVDGRCTSGGVVERDAGETEADGAAPDATTPDAVEPDARELDASADDGAPADSAPQDAATPDTALLDIAPADTAPFDTATLDTTAAEAAVPDTAALDSVGVDAVPVADAGQGDAAAVDAGAVDGAATDTGAADAGVPDAASPCALDAGGYDTPISFTPGMRVQAAPGPFNTGALVQGSPPEQTCSRGDVIVVGPGDAIGGGFYTHFDPGQGSLVLWATPEWDITDVADDSRVLFAAGEFAFGVDGPSLGAFVQVNGDTRVNFDGALDTWTPLSTHMVVLRWDSRNPFDGGHVALVVDDRLYQGVAQPFAPAPGGAEVIVGAADADGNGASGVLISGLTVYRRPLFNAQGGVRVNSEDEIAAIYDGGPGLDPGAVTGSWDVVLALPTHATSGGYRLPRGEAWSHPHGQSLAGAEGFLLGALAAGWSERGGDPELSAPAPGETIFGGGLKVQADPDEGVRRDFAVSPGTAVVLRVLVHSDGTARPRVWLLDAVSSEGIGGMVGTTSSTRDRPDVLLYTAQVPDGVDTLRVVLLSNAASAGSFVVHQLEVYENLVANPSLEDGAGDPYVPTGWTNENLLSGETWRETTTVHSGDACLGINAADSVDDFHQLLQTPASFAQLGHFYAVGGMFWWQDGGVPRVMVTNGCLVDQTRAPRQSAKLSLAGVGTSGAWQHLSGVGRRHHIAIDSGVNCYNNIVRWGGNWETGIHVLVDDAYALHLELTDIDVRPADLVASTSAGLLRVDRPDDATQPVTDISDASGTVSVRLAYPYRAAERDQRCPTGAMLFSLYGAPGNYINVRYAATGPQVEAELGGFRRDYTYIQGPDPLADRRPHDMVVTYTSSADIALLVDGDRLISMELRGATFDVLPDTLYFGRDASGDYHCDIVVDVGGAVFAP